MMAHTDLGMHSEHKGQVDEAIACYQKAIALDPTSVHAHYNLGDALEVKGKFDEAIAGYREVIALDPSSRPYNNLGDALKEGTWTRPSLLRKAIALIQGCHSPLQAGHLMTKGKVDEAIAEYRETIRLKEDYPEAHCNLGLALFAQGKLEEAIAAYRAAIRLKPDFATAHSNLGNALCAPGKAGGGDRRMRHRHPAQARLRRGPRQPRFHLY